MHNIGRGCLPAIGAGFHSVVRYPNCCVWWSEPFGESGTSLCRKSETVANKSELRRAQKLAVLYGVKSAVLAVGQHDRIGEKCSLGAPLALARRQPRRGVRWTHPYRRRADRMQARGSGL